MNTSTRLAVACLLAFSAFITAVPALADTWAIYWYVCGTDLERRIGAPSKDIAEALKADFGDDVTVVLQTGGTRQWQTRGISNRHIQRFLIRNGKLVPVATLPQANMGSSDTLADFLSFCLENYKADHRALIIWDHGGGSVGSFSIDENFNNSAMHLKDLREALESACDEDEEDPPLDFIGFDACLMATLDTANTVRGYAKYLIASQDVEPAIGWEYTGFLSALGADTDMDMETLGRHICDTFLIQAKRHNRSQGVTLSVVDIKRLPALNLLWNALGVDALELASKDRSFYARLGRQAWASENFWNIKGRGFSNMVDMGDFARRLQKELPGFAGDLRKALQKAVVYRVGGKYRNASGLSFYYPFDGGRSFATMLQQGDPSAFLVLQGLQTGKISGNHVREYLERVMENMQNDKEALRALEEEAAEEGGADEGGSDGGSETTGEAGSGGGDGGHPTPPDVSRLAAIASLAARARDNAQPPAIHSLKHLYGTPVAINAEGVMTMQLKPEDVEYVDAVYAFVGIMDMKKKYIVYLGEDADIDADWDHALFRDNYRNTWTALDGHALLLDTVHIEDNLYRYYIPIKLNGERVMLEVVYDFSEEAYSIIGAHPVMENGQPDKQLISLKPGDKVTTLLRATELKDDSPIREVEMDTFTLSENSKVQDVDLGDGDYFYFFEMKDIQGNTAVSDLVHISVVNGKIDKKNTQ